MRELTDPGQPSLTEENQLNVGKESLGSSHALFVQACWSEHRRSPDGRFCQFLRVLSEVSESQAGTVCLLKKSGYEDTAKAPKTRYEREMKT